MMGFPPKILGLTVILLRRSSSFMVEGSILRMLGQWIKP
jgi:hypothetical protein